MKKIPKKVTVYLFLRLQKNEKYKKKVTVYLNCDVSFIYIEVYNCDMNFDIRGYICGD